MVEAALRYLSWNVNGIRAALDKGLREFLATEAPDVLCLQETRALPEQVPPFADGYHVFWNPAVRKGYAGVAAISRREPLDVRRGMGMPEHDGEGRVLTLEFADHFLVNVYTPNAQRELARLDYRMRWDAAFLAFLKDLEKRKPVVTCGDFNVSHKPIDLARPKDNVHNAGFTVEERAGFDALVAAGFVDTFREFEPGGGHYTWWTYRLNARERNIGWRLDYFLVSASLRPRLARAWIMPGVNGSDHCPVGIELLPFE
jgi:exodeoxyribonuclease-3